MRKGIIILLLMLAVISIAGCNKKNGGGSSSKTGSVFKIARVWDRTGIRYHYNSGSNIGALAWLSCEPLVQYVRTTDELHYLLAESIEHNSDHTTIIHLRKNAKWHNGESFTADDVIAYYSMNFTSVTNYLSKFIEKVDENTVKLTWKTWKEPTDSTKTLMIAQDVVGTVQYSVFEEFVLSNQEILSSQKDCEEGFEGWAPFGKVNDSSADTLYNENYKKFMAKNPSVFVGTGPYKLQKLTQTQMLLTKNDDYYFADQIPYKTVLAYNISDLTTIYNMLLTGELDYQDGFAPDTTIEEITTTNTTMVHLKAYDPASVGILFNLEKDVWTDEVREAFQYIFDREEIKNCANKYAYASYYPVTGMVSTEAEKFMTKEAFDGIKQYSHDEEKSDKLLIQAGWTKEGGKWMRNGEEVKLTLGYDGSNAIMSSLAEAVQGALKKYGINCVLKRTADWGTWYSQASQKESYYDFTVNWTELGLSFAHPAGCYSFFFNDQNGPVIHLPRMTQEDLTKYGITEYEVGNINLYLDKYDGTGKFHAYQYLSKMYSMSDEELKSATNDLVYGIAGLNVGVNIMRNVSGGFYNTAVIGNLPMKEIWSSGTRDVTTIPEMYSEEYYALARISLEFAHGAALTFQYKDAKLDG